MFNTMNKLCVFLLCIQPVFALKIQTDTSASFNAETSRWALGNEGEDCTKTCTDLGMACTADSETKQTGLDTSEKSKEAIFAALASKGLPTSGYNANSNDGRNYEFAPMVSNGGRIFYWKFGLYNGGGSNTQSHCTPPTQTVSGHITPICWCEAAPPAGGGGNGGKAAGDPHLLNVKGEKFNINRMGYAPLVSIASDGAANLEVMALIEGGKKCQKKMFISKVNASGIWLEKNIAVTVGFGNEKGNTAFSVTVDGQEVWSPAAVGYVVPPTGNTVFKHAGKFSIDEMTATSAQQPGIELKTAHDVKMKIVRPLHRTSATPHLNFDITGLAKLAPSFKLGGLLGHDDHSYWSTPDPNCGANYARFAEAQVEDSRATAQ